MSGVSKNAPGARTENDGRPVRPNTPSNLSGGSDIRSGGSPIRSGGNPAQPGVDRTRANAAPAVGGQSQARTDAQWAPLTDVPGFNAARGDADRLMGHGVKAGIVNGVLVIARKDVPHATQLLGG
jgi:hypothetical protein